VAAGGGGVLLPLVDAALVHLVTLGWLTFSIFGAMYIVAPLALRTTMPVRRGDYVAYAAALTGLIGMVAHSPAGAGACIRVEREITP
jgi:hypothetical protein